MGRAGSPFQRREQRSVPRLAITGERTLPDVPSENYWYQRHVAVYRWVASRASGKRVVDMACGEGYGSRLLAEIAESVIGVDANPEAYEHARLKYTGGNLQFEQQLIEEFTSPADVLVFLQTIEHIRDPDRALRHFRAMVAPTDGEVVISTPNVLTLAPPGAVKSDNPWHVREYRPDDFYALLTPYFRQIELFGLYPAGTLARYDRALRRLRGAGGAAFRTVSTGASLGVFQRFVKTTDFEIHAATNTSELETALDLVAAARV